MLGPYDKYKHCCPNSILAEDQITEAQMKAAVNLFERHERQCKENLVAPPTEGERLKYEAWKAKRKISSVLQLPIKQLELISAAINSYREMVGDVDRVFLSGSYASGSWVDENSSDEDRHIRAIFKAPKIYSDIDLVPEPFSGALVFGRCEFTKVPKGRRVLIYENEQLCI